MADVDLEAKLEKAEDERDEATLLYQEWHGRTRDLEAELERVKAERDYHQQHNVTLGICVDKLSARAEAAEARLAEAKRVLQRIADEFKQPGHLAGHYARAFLTKEPSHAD